MILVCHRTLHNWISSSNLGLAGLVRTKASCCVIKGLLILPFPVSAVSQVRSLSSGVSEGLSEVGQSTENLWAPQA